jgi:hypothetical protein
MTFEQKGTWVFLVVSVGTFAAYATIILGRADVAPLKEVEYVSTMLWTIGIAVGLSILGHIAVAISNPSEADKADVRDKQIYRFGEYVGGIFLAAGMIVPFALTLAEFDHFWIAHAMYAVFFVSSIIGTVVKLVAYRRGI